jgi:hypothetical protein
MEFVYIAEESGASVEYEGSGSCETVVAEGKSAAECLLVESGDQTVRPYGGLSQCLQDVSTGRFPSPPFLSLVMRTTVLSVDEKVRREAH